MSKCWYCNEELTTANYCDEHIGICTKCYGSMFQVSNEFVKGLMDKIADLEAKLAESEKKILELQEQSIRDNQIYNEELAEKEKEIEKLKEPRLIFQNKLDIEEVRKRLNAEPCIVVGLDTSEIKMLSPDQDKISFAVEQLEKVKVELVNKVSPVKLSYNEYVQEVFNKLNNQIEELKKEMK